MVQFYISKWGLHAGACETHLQSHWRAPQPAVPPTETLNRGPKRKCSSSPWNNGKETGLLGVTLHDLTLACWTVLIDINVYMHACHPFLNLLLRLACMLSPSKPMQALSLSDSV